MARRRPVAAGKKREEFAGLVVNFVTGVVPRPLGRGRNRKKKGCACVCVRAAIVENRPFETKEFSPESVDLPRSVTRGIAENRHRVLSRFSINSVQQTDLNQV